MQCPRCGFLMKETDRACVNCGLLNTSHQLNEYLVENLSSVEANRQFERSHDINAFYRPSGAFYVTFMLFLGLCGVASLFVAIADKVVGFALLFSSAFSVFELACLANLLQRQGTPWWALLVPIANIYYIYNLAFDNAGVIIGILVVGGAAISLGNLVFAGFSYILALVYTVAFLIINLMFCVKFAKKFNANAILTFFFFPIMVPYIAIREDSK